MRRLVLASGVGVAVLASAGSAQALTKLVVAGPPKVVKGVFGKNERGDVNAFSLKQVTIHVGDSVRWERNGFHSVTFNKKGGGDIPLTITDPTGTTNAGLIDFAGKPFWFDSLVRTLVNPQGAFRLGGKTEDGSTLTGSGLPFGNGKPPSFTLKFTKTGVFKYECVVHPGMDGSVKVVAKGKKIPSAADDKKAVAKQLAAEVKLVKTLLSFTPPAGTVSGGHDQGQVVILKFFPDTVHVPVGGTVTFSVAGKTEVHTFTFGPAAFRTALQFAAPVPVPGGPPFLVVNPILAFPSDPPPTLPPYDGTAHGDGFFNTGLERTGTPPLAPSSTITFTKAGSFEFQCMIHKEMKGTVIVG